MRCCILALILLAACGPLPPAEPGCDWAYLAASIGDCGDNTIFCDAMDRAVILCDGFEIDTDAPCETGEDGYPEIDYTVCDNTIGWLWGKRAGDMQEEE